jgi:hypothetical protein
MQPMNLVDYLRTQTLCIRIEESNRVLYLGVSARLARRFPL